MFHAELPAQRAPAVGQAGSAHTLFACCDMAGNYDTFQKTVRENETIQAKQYAKEQDDIK